MKKQMYSLCRMDLYDILRTISDNGMFWILERNNPMRGKKLSAESMNTFLGSIIPETPLYNFIKHVITTDTVENENDKFTKEFIRSEWAKFYTIEFIPENLKLLFTQFQNFDSIWKQLTTIDKLHIIYAVARFIDYIKIEDMLEEAYREISSSTSKQVSGIMQHLLNVVIYIECM